MTSYPQRSLLRTSSSNSTAGRPCSTNLKASYAHVRTSRPCWAEVSRSPTFPLACQVSDKSASAVTYLLLGVLLIVRVTDGTYVFNPQIVPIQGFSYRAALDKHYTALLTEYINSARTFSALITYILYGRVKSARPKPCADALNSFIRFGKLRATFKLGAKSLQGLPLGASLDDAETMAVDDLDLHDDGDTVREEDLDNKVTSPHFPLGIVSKIRLVDPSKCGFQVPLSN